MRIWWNKSKRWLIKFGDLFSASWQILHTPTPAYTHTFSAKFISISKMAFKVFCLRRLVHTQTLKMKYIARAMWLQIVNYFMWFCSRYRIRSGALQLHCMHRNKHFNNSTSVQFVWSMKETWKKTEYWYCCSCCYCCCCYKVLFHFENVYISRQKWRKTQSSLKSNRNTKQTTTTKKTKKTRHKTNLCHRSGYWVECDTHSVIHM